jgi:hypothetical protein
MKFLLSSVMAHSGGTDGAHAWFYIISINRRLRWSERVKLRKVKSFEIISQPVFQPIWITTHLSASYAASPLCLSVGILWKGRMDEAETRHQKRENKNVRQSLSDKGCSSISIGLT